MGRVQLSHGLRADGRMIAVSDAERGVACGLVCPGCGSELVARKGEVLQHHFAHAVGPDCTTALESMLHRLAKQVLADEKKLRLPPVAPRIGRWVKKLADAIDVSAPSVQIEAQIGKFRADALMVDGDTKLVVEFRVTHACTAEKLEFFAQSNLEAIEIDLSGMGARSSSEDVRQFILLDAPRRWLFNEEGAKEQESMERWLARKREREATRIPASVKSPPVTLPTGSVADISAIMAEIGKGSVEVYDWAEFDAWARGDADA